MDWVQLLTRGAVLRIENETQSLPTEQCCLRARALSRFSQQDEQSNMNRKSWERGKTDRDKEMKEGSEKSPDFQGSYLVNSLSSHL